MKFFKYTVLALALAAGFTSCSDDDDYVPGGASAGVYFPTDDALDVTLDRNKSSFDVIVARMGETKAASYELVGSADEDVFTLPTSVSFAEGETSTTIAIAYRQSEMAADRAYPVILSFASGTQICNYGYESLDMNVTLPAPWKTVGTGLYHDQWLLTISVWAEENPDVEIAWETELQQHEVETNRYRWVHPYGDAFAKFCSVNNLGELEPGEYDNKNQYYIEFIVDEKTGLAIIPAQRMGFEFYSFGEMSVANDGGYEYSNGAPFNAIISQIPESCSTVEFDEDGTPITLHSAEKVLLYYRPETDGWYYSPGSGYQWTAEGVDLKNYNINLTYSGVLTTPDENSYVLADIKLGADLAKAVVGLVPTEDEEAAIEAVRAGEVPVQEFTENTSARFEFNGSANYVLAAIGYNADGEEVSTATVSFFVADSSAPKEWKKLGTGIMVDGWICPSFSVSGVRIDPMKYAYYIDIEENIENPGVYRILQPWTTDKYPGRNLNEYTGDPVNIVVDARDAAAVSIQPQFSGFFTTYDDGSSAAFYVTSLADYYASDGYTNDQIVAKGVDNVLEEGMLYISAPTFGQTDNVGDPVPAIADCAYTFYGKTPYSEDQKYCPGIFQLPDASAAAVAKAHIRKAGAQMSAQLTADRSIRAAKAQLAKISPRTVSAKAMKRAR